MSTITQRTKNLLANARLVQRCKEDPKLTRRIPIIVREALGIPYEDLTYLPKRRNAVWKVRKTHMMMDKTRPSKAIIEEGTALVPLRIDEDGTYYIKLSDSREQEDKGRHWIEVKLLTDSNG